MIHPLTEPTRGFTAPTRRGFTLVETLVAITIIAIAIVGPFSAIQKALNASKIARDSLIASALAQEGIEYVRNLRDDNYLYVVGHPGSTRSWLYGLDGSGGNSVDCFAPKICRVDATQAPASAIAVCSGTCSPLYLSASNLYNQQNSGTATRFTRSVRLTTVTANEVRVTVTVSWSTAHRVESVVVSEDLYNWL